jgi:putative endopeptidase
MIPQYVVTATINTSYDLSLTNAFYSPTLNSIFIYPSLLFSPVIPEGVSEARTFAAFTIIGHEMTHGFDLQGSNYNAWGEKESWWTVADKMEFDDRNRLLIDCYNHLQFDPFQYPNTFANGERTVTENVADLGGFMIVLDAYIAYLKKNGYFGESYLNQLRRFYESYADLWAVKYSAKKLQSIIDEDVHSHARCRINGVVMNTDLWYELYHVDRDNVLYLPKERRTYIW